MHMPRGIRSIGIACPTPPDIPGRHCDPARFVQRGRRVEGLALFDVGLLPLLMEHGVVRVLLRPWGRSEVDLHFPLLGVLAV